MAQYYIGIDFGGMSAKAGLFDAKAQLLAKDTVATSKDDAYMTTVAKMGQLVKKLCADNGVALKDVKRVGLASPGVIDGENGVVVRWGNYHWEDRPLAKDLSSAIGIEVRIVNDANAAAYGEYAFGAAKAYKNNILITLGTGVGSGIIIGGKLFEGRECAGAEAGHMVIVCGGERCNCGRRGCWEAYASVSALIRQTKAAMELHPDSLMHEEAAAEGKVSGKTAFVAAKRGDKAAQEVVDKYIDYVGEGLVNLADIFRPDVILLGGAISKEGERLTAPLQKKMDAEAFGAKFNPRVAVKIASLRNDAGILGAAALVCSDRA